MSKELVDSVLPSLSETNISDPLNGRYEERKKNLGSVLQNTNAIGTHLLNPYEGFLYGDGDRDEAILNGFLSSVIVGSGSCIMYDASKAFFWEIFDLLNLSIVVGLNIIASFILPFYALGQLLSKDSNDAWTAINEYDCGFLETACTALNCAIGLGTLAFSLLNVVLLVISIIPRAIASGLVYFDLYDKVGSTLAYCLAPISGALSYLGNISINLGGITEWIGEAFSTGAGINPP